MSLPWRGWLPLSPAKRERLDTELRRFAEGLDHEREQLAGAAFEAFAQAKGEARWMRAYLMAAPAARSARALLALRSQVPFDSDYPQPVRALAAVERLIRGLFEDVRGDLDEIPSPSPPLPTPTPTPTHKRCPSITLADFAHELLSATRDPKRAVESHMIVDDEPWHSQVLADIALGAQLPAPIGWGMEVAKVEYREVTAEPWPETVHDATLSFRFHPSMDGSLPPDSFELRIACLAILEGGPRVAALLRDEAEREKIRMWVGLVHQARQARGNSGSE